MTYRIEDHHPATQQLLRFFEWEHLPKGPLQNQSMRFQGLARSVLYDTPPGPEVTTCLRKLLESKDCAVRALLPAPEPQAATTP